MAKDSTIRIQFIYDKTSRVLSRKQYELQGTEALSHAAKVSYQRRRQQREFLLTKQSRDRSSDSHSTRQDSNPATTSSLPTIYYLDPFFNVPHPRLGSFYRAMEIWFQWILPNARPAFLIFNVRNIFESYLSGPGCQSEAVLHSIAALAYGCIELHRKEADIWEFNYSREQLKHNSLAISLLKKDIASKRADADGPSALNAIFLLSYLAQFRGDHQESALHRTALRRLFGSCAELADRPAFDRRFGGLMMQFSCWTDVLEGRPNVLEIPLEKFTCTALTSAFNLSGATRGYDVDTKLPLGFQGLVERQLLSEETSRLLARFSHACIYGLDAVPKPEQQFTDYASASPYLTTPEPSLEKYLLLVLLCYSHMRWTISTNYVAGILCHTTSRTKLAQGLPLVLDNNDAVIIECLVWMWMVLIDSHRLEGSVLPKAGLSCLGEFKFHYPDWSSWTRIEAEVLPKFFWREADSVAIKKAWNY